MNDSSDFDDAVSEATARVEERAAAAEEAAERARPKSSGPRLVIALLVLGGVIAWNVYTLARPPAELPVADQETDLAWLVTDAVDLIESIREDTGALPAAADLADLMDEDVSYTRSGEAYVVAAESDGVRIEYDSSIEIEKWMATRGLSLNQGGSP